MKFYFIYLLIINVVGAVVTTADKRRAQRRQFRVPERVLFGLAFLGGGIGVYATMFAIRHKTKHWSFLLGIPLLMLLHVGIVVGLIGLL